MFNADSGAKQGYTSGKIDSSTFFKSDGVREILSLNKDPSSLLSHAQLEMVSGTQSAGSSDLNVSFNSEETLQRQQVWLLSGCIYIVCLGLFVNEQA